MNREPARTRASVPAGTLVYAVGDTHGRRDLLDILLERIRRDAAELDAGHCLLVFLGDYVDRGPDSAGVIDRLVSGPIKGFETVCLKGNHEAIMLDFLAGKTPLDHWLDNGAAATFASYGVDEPAFGWHAADAEACRSALDAALPSNHRQFLDTLAGHHQCGDYFFAHAGVRPGVALDAQRPMDLIWIREAFLESDADFGKVVVHGHTPGREPVVRPNRIGIDTGAWTRGTLTALRLWGDTREFLTAEAG